MATPARGHEKLAGFGGLRSLDLGKDRAVESGNGDSRPSNFEVLECDPGGVEQSPDPRVGPLFRRRDGRVSVLTDVTQTGSSFVCWVVPRQKENP